MKPIELSVCELKNSPLSVSDPRGHTCRKSVNRDDNPSLERLARELHHSSVQPISQGKSAMNAAIEPMIQINPLFMRVDLLIEVGKLELAVANIRRQKAANEAEPLVAPLASRIARLNEALGRLTA